MRNESTAASATPFHSIEATWNCIQSHCGGNDSNPGHVLLGIFVHETSGRFHGDVLRDRVFVQSGMTTARIIDDADRVMHRSAGHRLVEGSLKSQAWVAPKLNTTAEGSLYLSIDDWIHWEGAFAVAPCCVPRAGSAIGHLNQCNFVSHFV